MKRSKISLLCFLVISFFLFQKAFAGGTQHWTNNTVPVNSPNTITGKTYIALPMRETYIPDDVAMNLKNKIGASLYDITRLGEASPANSLSNEYVIRLVNKGVITSRVVDGNGNTLNNLKSF